MLNHKVTEIVPERVQNGVDSKAWISTGHLKYLTYFQWPPRFFSSSIFKESLDSADT